MFVQSHSKDNFNAHFLLIKLKIKFHTQATKAKINKRDSIKLKTSVQER